MKKNKIIFALIICIILLLAVFGFSLANSRLYQHSIQDGKLIDAIGFSDGSSIVVTTHEDEIIAFSYYNSTGEELFRERISLSDNPETLIINVCGGYIQAVFDYQNSNFGGRVVLFSDDIPRICLDRIFIPFISK